MLDHDPVAQVLYSRAVEAFERRQYDCLLSMPSARVEEFAQEYRPHGGIDDVLFSLNDRRQARVRAAERVLGARKELLDGLREGWWCSTETAVYK